MSEVANNKIQTNSLDNNKIQAKKPEVGDVWRSDAHTIYIVRITKSGFIHNIFCDAQGFHTGRTELDFIQTYCKYLGKSKVNIKELFDVENAK